MCSWVIHVLPPHPLLLIKKHGLYSKARVIDEKQWTRDQLHTQHSTVPLHSGTKGNWAGRLKLQYMVVLSFTASTVTTMPEVSWTLTKSWKKLPWKILVNQEFWSLLWQGKHTSATWWFELLACGKRSNTTFSFCMPKQRTVWGVTYFKSQNMYSTVQYSNFHLNFRQLWTPHQILWVNCIWDTAYN